MSDHAELYENPYYPSAPYELHVNGLLYQRFKTREEAFSALWRVQEIEAGDKD